MFLSVCLKKNFLIVGAILSLILLGVAIALIAVIFPIIIEGEIKSSVKLENGTDQYDRFVELPFPISFKIYVFHVKNKDRLVQGIDTKPDLEEVGPFVYKQYRLKTIHSVDTKDDTISYTQTETFEFDQLASFGRSEEDVFTVLNPAMISILQIAETLGDTALNMIADCINEIFDDFNTVFIDVTVRELLFTGISFCKPKISFCGLRQAAVCDIAKTKKFADEMEDKSLRFSLFNYKARSDDGLYTVKRGTDDVKTLGSIIKLNNSTHTEFWGGPGSTAACDEVKGTDATLYPPGIEKDSVFQIYSTDICRSVEITYLREDAYKGIKGYVFSTNETTLRSSGKNKEDDCFCAEQTKGIDGMDTCFLDGVIDVQPCTGVPVLLSFPHFLWADPSYSNALQGLSANEERHRTYLKVEPHTGTPLQGSKRIQINLVLRPLGKVDIMKNVPRVIMPIIWLDEGVSLTNEYIDLLNDMYFDKMKIVSGVQWALLSLSVLTTAFFGSLTIYKMCKR